MCSLIIYYRITKYVILYSTIETHRVRDFKAMHGRARPSEAGQRRAVQGAAWQCVARQSTGGKCENSHRV